MGRDVVGYLSKKRHEGEWHNYQCKQYGRTLRTGLGLAEVGKVLYYSHRGEFTPPTRFFFVAPRGLHRDLKRFISKPNEFKAALLSTWDQNCARSIVENQFITLTPELRAFIEGYDFSAITQVAADDILLNSASKAVLQAWFDVDPGPAPLGMVPSQITAIELPYVQALLDAYGEREDVDWTKRQHVHIQNTASTSTVNENASSMPMPWRNSIETIQCNRSWSVCDVTSVTGLKRRTRETTQMGSRAQTL